MPNDYEVGTSAARFGTPVVVEEAPLSTMVAQLREEVNTLRKQLGQQREEIMALQEAVRIENIDRALAERLHGRR